MHPDAEAPATPLFRNEALRFQAARLQGEVFLKLRSPWLVLGVIVASCAIAVVAAAAMLTYERKERATGTLESAQGSTHLEAQLRIAPAAIGFIQSGQPVRLRCDAFRDLESGRAQGKIASVSVEPAADGFHRAWVVLERDYVQARGERIALRPGMSVTGEIVVERRPMLEWLFAPLYALGNRS